MDAAEAMVTMCPPPRARMAGAIKRTPRITPRTFTANMASEAFGGSVSNGPTHITPALFTSTSIGPRSCVTASTKDVYDDSSVTSSG